LVWRLAQIVLEAAVQGCLFLFLPPFEDYFPPTEVDIGRRHIPDPFVTAPMVQDSMNFAMAARRASGLVNTRRFTRALSVP